MHILLHGCVSKAVIQGQSANEVDCVTEWCNTVVLNKLRALLLENKYFIFVASYWLLLGHKKLR
jgi:hypothetical protein